MLSAVSVTEDFRGCSVMDDRREVSTAEVLLLPPVTVPDVVSAIEGRLLADGGLTGSGENSLLLLKLGPLGVTGDALGMPPMYRDLFKSVGV